MRGGSLTYRSKHVFNAGLDWKPTDAWSLGLQARYNGAQFISVPANGQNMVEAPSYAIVDLSMAWRAMPNLTLRAGLLNAADKRVDRSTYSEFNEDGRRAYLSASARF